LNNSTLWALYKIHNYILSGSHPNVSSLSEKLELSQRTIKRYISCLKYDFDAPIKYSKIDEGYYYTQDWDFPFPNLTEGELISLFMTVNLLEEFKGTSLEKDIVSLQKKLELLLSKKTKINGESFIKVLLKPLKPKKDVKEVFSKIFNAIKERKKLKIKYWAIHRKELTERIVEPYLIFNSEGIWYFAGYCELRKDYRDFALDRIDKIEILNESYKPRDFDFKDYIGKAFKIYKGNTRKITLLFDSYEANWIKERIWHSSQEIKELPDGKLLFEIKANPEEIKRWIIGYGASVEVIEPKTLREEIKDEVLKLSKIYKE
jgi:predicted DNA-binding transcriptional regulator YafY